MLTGMAKVGTATYRWSKLDRERALTSAETFPASIQGVEAGCNSEFAVMAGQLELHHQPAPTGGGAVAVVL